MRIFTVFLLLMILSLNSFAVDRIIRAASGTGITFQTGGSSTRMQINSAGLVTISNDLTVNGTLLATITLADLSTAGDLSVDGTSTLTGDVSMGSDLDVAGTSTFGSSSFGTTTDVGPSTLVQFVSTVSGILLPRMTLDQRNVLATTSADGGLMVFTTDASGTSADIFDGDEWVSAIPKVAYVKDIKANGILGGTCTAGAWNERDVNVIEGDTDIVDFASSTAFTLATGTYNLEAYAPATSVNRHQARLFDFTNNVNIATGTSEFAAAAGTDDTKSIIFAHFTLAADASLGIVHRCQTTNASDGFGLAVSFGSEVYTIIKITKIR